MLAPLEIPFAGRSGQRIWAFCPFISNHFADSSDSGQTRCHTTRHPNSKPRPHSNSNCDGIGRAACAICGAQLDGNTNLAVTPTAVLFYLRRLYPLTTCCDGWRYARHSPNATHRHRSKLHSLHMQRASWRLQQHHRWRRSMQAAVPGPKLHGG